MEVTDRLRSYIEDKLRKNAHIFDIALGIEVECIENIAARGVDKDYRVEISMILPRTPVRVEKFGSDMFAAVDEAVDVLQRKVKRYKDKLRQWEGKDSWKVTEAEETEENGDQSDDPPVTYTPKIVKRKKLEDCMPIAEIEAIERMEMMGYDSFLFKNKKNGKFCLVYRRRQGGYGIVEPCEV